MRSGLKEVCPEQSTHKLISGLKVVDLEWSTEADIRPRSRVEHLELIELLQLPELN